MRRIKVFAGILAVLMVLVGCSTYQLPSDSTSAQKKAALCADAKAAFAMADSALAVVDPMLKDQELRNYLIYWSVFRAGAQVGIHAYCGAQ